jgi:hypothetical protein
VLGAAVPVREAQGKGRGCTGQGMVEGELNEKRGGGEAVKRLGAMVLCGGNGGVAAYSGRR